MSFFDDDSYDTDKSESRIPDLEPGVYPRLRLKSLMGRKTKVGTKMVKATVQVVEANGGAPAGSIRSIALFENVKPELKGYFTRETKALFGALIDEPPQNVKAAMADQLLDPAKQAELGVLGTEFAAEIKVKDPSKKRKDGTPFTNAYFASAGATTTTAAPASGSTSRT